MAILPGYTEGTRQSPIDNEAVKKRVQVILDAWGVNPDDYRGELGSPEQFFREEAAELAEVDARLIAVARISGAEANKRFHDTANVLNGRYTEDLKLKYPKLKIGKKSRVAEWPDDDIYYGRQRLHNVWQHILQYEPNEETLTVSGPAMLDGVVKARVEFWKAFRALPQPVQQAVTDYYHWSRNGAGQILDTARELGLVNQTQYETIRGAESQNQRVLFGGIDHNLDEIPDDKPHFYYWALAEDDHGENKPS